MTNKFFPIYHSLHVLAVLLIPLVSFFLICCPHCHSLPPPFPTEPRLHHSLIPPASVCQCLDHLPSAFLFNTKSLANKVPRIHRRTSSFFTFCLLLLAGDVEVNPGPIPFTQPTFNLASFNIRSASSITNIQNKPEILKHIIHDHKIDIVCLTETWLNPDTPPAIINSLLPPSFSFAHCPRPQGGGGGVGLLYNNKNSVKNITIPKYVSFEIQCISFTINPSFRVRSASLTTAPFILFNIYRPPSSSKPTFIAEFTSLLEDFISSSSELIITGDFNLHLDDPSAPYVASFSDLLDTFNLTQHISFPTHDSGHTLDLLITRSASTLVSSIDQTYTPISDHKVILSTLTIPTQSRSPRITKLIRPINLINTADFSNDIFASCLYTSPALTLADYQQQFSSTLLALLDKHAPEKNHIMSFSPPQTFYNT